MQLPLWLTQTTDQALSARKKAAQKPYQVIADFSLKFYHLSRIFLLLFLAEQYFLLSRLGYPEGTLLLLALYLMIHFRTCFVAYQISIHIAQKNSQTVQLRILNHFQLVHSGISATLFVLMTSALFILFSLVSADTYNILKVGTLIINILACGFLYINNEMPAIVVIFLSSSDYQKKEKGKRHQKFSNKQIASV